MGMNFDYGTLGVNNNYATSFKGSAGASQAASMPIMDGPSDLELLTLSTKQKENKKNDTMKKAGIVAGIAATIAVVVAYSKGKKINGADGSLFKNIGTGFKNFFKNADDVAKVTEKTVKKGTTDAAKGAGKAANGAGKAAKGAKTASATVTQEMLDAASQSATAAQKKVNTAQAKVDKATKALKNLTQGTPEYDAAQKTLDAAQKQLDTAQTKLTNANKKLTNMAAGKSLGADKTYTKLKDAKSTTDATLKGLQTKKANLAKEETRIQKGIDKLDDIAKNRNLTSDESKKLSDYQARLTKTQDKLKTLNGTGKGSITEAQTAYDKAAKQAKDYKEAAQQLYKSQTQAETSKKIYQEYLEKYKGFDAQKQAQAKGTLNTLKNAAASGQTQYNTAQNTWNNFLSNFKA